MKGKGIFGVLVVMTLLVALTRGAYALPVATVNAQGHPATDLAVGQVADVAAVSAASVRDEGPVVYVACDPADISDDIQAP